MNTVIIPEEKKDFVNYIAQDRDGSIHGYNGKPSTGSASKNTAGIWMSNPNGTSTLLVKSDGKVNVKWKQTLLAVR